MVDIPKQLQSPEFRFARVKPNTKVAYDRRWNSTNNYIYSSPIWKEESSYIVVGGFGNLLVVDFDSREMQEKHLSELPETFTVRTARRKLYHLYYRIKEGPVESATIKTEKMDFICDKKGVLGPNSMWKNGETYDIVNDVPIAEISISTLRKVFGQYGFLLDDQSKNGHHKQIPCPFTTRHEGNIDRNPSMHIYDNGTCHCFACGVFGYEEIVMHKSSGKRFAEETPTKKGTFMGVQVGDFQRYRQQHLDINDTQQFQEAIIDAYRDYLEMARKFSLRQPIYFDKGHNFWLWGHKKKCWERVDETDLLIKVDNALHRSETINPRDRTMIVESLRRVGRQKAPKPTKKTWVQFADKIIDASNPSEVIEPTPEYFITNPIPYSLGKSSDTPTMDKLFGEWVGDDYVSVLYEIIAFTCLSSYPLHRIFVLFGDGSNGKGKYVGVLSKFIGVDNITSSELDILRKNRFETATLYRKLVCLMTETNAHDMIKTSVLKKLTGEDPIKFEFKFKTGFTDYNYAKLIISSNELPKTYDKTKGFYRRFMIIDFPNTFTEERDVLAEIPEQEYQNLARKITKILPRLLKDRRFSEEQTLEERRQRYEERSNPVMQFVEKKCKLDIEASYKLSIFSTAFNIYSKKHKMRSINSRLIAKHLRDEGFLVHKTTHDGETATWIEGLSIPEIPKITQHEINPFI